MNQTRSRWAEYHRWLHEQIILRGIVAIRGEGRVFSYVEDLRARQFDTVDRVAERQHARVKELLQYAAERSPYYRSRLKAADGHIVALADAPFLTKAILQAQLDELRAQPSPAQVTLKTTGGSTGQAVTVIKDRDALAREMAATWLAYGWFGVRPGDKSARFWGAAPTIKRRLRAAAVRFAVRRVNFSAFAFDEADLEAYWRRCLSYRPVFLYGYVSMLEAFADFVRRRGYDGASLGLSSIITTSEVLGEPQRRLLEQVFGTRVQNEYGCGEVGPIAYECEQGALHVMAENLFVELRKEDGTIAGPGESGEVVITDLNNRATPLIRYRVGDFATWGASCTCGRGWPTFTRVWGREYDFVLAPDGRRYHGEFFMYMFEDLKDARAGIRQFQVVQRAADQLEVSLVIPDLSATVRQSVERVFAERLPGMQLTLRQVESIPRAASGKLRLIRNDWVAPRAG